ncbi:hypothetical protein RF11_01874 [Thelohanellus kitauei]|uniref:Uncharacterized protein n=1 Tax=Thelohanellus kitauei TaxID=669202 RepID=A0A0C2MFJ5_THEKT|nr:hypothetical protein RF11_01874 [Thelohanellus kitauei]
MEECFRLLPVINRYQHASFRSIRSRQGVFQYIAFYWVFTVCPFHILRHGQTDCNALCYFALTNEKLPGQCFSRKSVFLALLVRSVYDRKPPVYFEVNMSYKFSYKCRKAVVFLPSTVCLSSVSAVNFLFLTVKQPGLESNIVNMDDRYHDS